MTIKDDEKPKHPLEHLRDNFANMSIVEIAMAQAEAKKDYEAKKTASTAAKDYHEFIQQVILPDAMEDAGIEGFKVPDLGRVNLQGDLYCSVKKDHGTLLEQWLIDNGLEDMIGKNVNSSTLKAFVREQMKKKGGIYPQELLNITPFTKAVITKG